MSNFDNGLTPAQAERLALLAEEAGELIHVIGKALRHGLGSSNPDKPNDPAGVSASPGGRMTETKPLALAAEAMQLAQAENVTPPPWTSDLDRVAQFGGDEEPVCAEVYSRGNRDLIIHAGTYYAVVAKALLATAARLAEAEKWLDKLAHALEEAAEGSDYCYSCDCHPSHGHESCALIAASEHLARRGAPPA